MSVSCLFVFSPVSLFCFVLIAPSQVTALSRRDTLFSVVCRHSRLPPLKRPLVITVHCLAELAPRHVCVDWAFGRVVESRQRSNVTLGLVVGVWSRQPERQNSHWHTRWWLQHGERWHEEDRLAADFSVVTAEQTVSEGPRGRLLIGDVYVSCTIEKTERVCSCWL